MDIEIVEIEDSIAFPLYEVSFYFVDNERTMLEYFSADRFIERLGYTTGYTLHMTVRVGLFNLECLYDYFNEDTASFIKEEILNKYSEDYD